MASLKICAFRAAKGLISRPFIPVQVRKFRSIIALLLLLAVAGVVLPREVATFARDDREQTSYFIDDESINSLQKFFRATTAATEKQFAGQQGQISGFGAGTTYPQIWLRDSATAIPITRFYYSSEFLTSWIEEHLAYQKPDGSLNDWIASGTRENFLPGAPRAKEVYRSAETSPDPVVVSADKNTTEADQETSAVDAAYQVFQIKGDHDWLRKKIGAVSIIQRLDRSLSYLLTARFDRRHGLITNAFTADWGDVSPVYSDQRAIYLDAKTPLVAGLYTNVLFYRATMELSEMFRAIGQLQRAAYWTRKGASVKRNINRYLWQEQRGFYRMHISLTHGKRQFDDSNMFAMGGNGLAILYSVADEGQAARVFDVGAERQRDFGVSTIAAVLLPPFPSGFFRHPALSQEYKYQNGGQWDWFAGRFLLAEFERGDAIRASEQLIAVAAKAAANNGLYEWHTRDGKGLGSPHYLGSAGALGQALFQGLYGVYLNAESLNLKIRLAKHRARVNIHEPSTGALVSYEYSNSDNATIVLTYQSSFPKVGDVCVLLPGQETSWRLLLDGKRNEFTTVTTGKDRYGCFATNWRHHRAEFQRAEPQQPVEY